jgi:hypothetical protein
MSVSNECKKCRKGIFEKFVGKAIQSVSVEVAFPDETKRIFQLHRLKETKNRLCETILKFQKIRFFCPSTVLNPMRLAQKSDALPTEPDGSEVILWKVVLFTPVCK